MFDSKEFNGVSQGAGERREPVITHPPHYQIDVGETSRFLSLLDPEATEFIFGSFDDNKERDRRRRAKQEDGVPPQHRHSALAAALPWMTARQALGASCCITIQPMVSARRRIDGVAGFRAVFAELDGPATKAWPLHPSLVINTSPGKFHAYWLIDPEHSISAFEFEGVERRLVADYGSDPAAKDIARALRLPGTWNLKPGRDPHLVRIVEAGGARYSRDELLATFPPVPVEKPKDAKRQDFKAFRGKGELADFVSPMQAIDPDDYATWLEVGFAIHQESGGSDEGLRMWDGWSSGSEKWSAGECAYRWQTFRAGGGITGGTIIHLAKGAGWRPEPPRQQRRRSAATDIRRAEHEAADADAAATAQEGLWTPNSAWLPAEGFKLLRDGSVAYAAGEDETGQTIWRFLCSPFEVAALTSDEARQGHGRLLRVFDQTNQCVHEWAMPASFLAGDASALLGQLLDLGLRVSLKAARAHMADLIMRARPPRIARCVSQTGWHGDAFVFPTRMIAKGGHFEVVLQARSAVRDKFMPHGTLEGWQQRVSRLAIGNSRLALAIAGAFVGPCLALVNQDGGGIHVYGFSSTGKTTTLRCAGSVWGGSDKGGFVDNWRHTSNGLEAKAQAHSDTLLCLEELGQAQAETAIDSAYLLANGQGRGRMSSDTAMRKTARWRIFFMSDGEVTLDDRAAELGKKKLAAGQIVRVINIAADAGKGYGLFDELHGTASPRDLAELLRAATQEEYGTAAPAFLERLVHDLDGATTFLRTGIDQFVKAHAESTSSQVQRVAQRFGLIAAVGALAVRYGVLPWREDEAYRAAQRCFEEWLAARGSHGQIETVQGITQVRRMLEAHGASRFSAWFETQPNGPVYDRLGFVKQPPTTSGTTYYILPEGWKEICKGFNATEIAKELAEMGALIKNTDGKLRRKERLPGIGKTTWCYVVDAGALFGSDDDQGGTRGTDVDLQGEFPSPSLSPLKSRGGQDGTERGTS